MTIKPESVAVGEKVFDKMKKVTTDSRDEYGRYCLRLPLLLRESGLSQAVGYLNANNSSVATSLAKDFMEVLGIHDPQTNDNLTLIVTTRKAWRVSQWFKHLAQIYFNLDLTDTESGND